MATQSSERSLIETDRFREIDLINGSRKMLKALWARHPRIMRIAYSQGRAQSVKEAWLAAELNQTKRQLAESVDCISEAVAKRRITPAEIVAVIEHEALSRQPETGQRLVQSVADGFDISYGELIGEGRARKYVEARVVVVAVLRERGWSFPKIGRLLGNRDHSTICHAMDIFDVYAKRNPMVAQMFLRFRPNVVVA